jgi:arylsulfatase A-like enzyme
LWLAVGRPVCHGPRVRLIVDVGDGAISTRVHERVLSAREACTQWYPLRVSLRPFGGRRVELSIRAEAVGETPAHPPPVVLIGDPLIVPAVSSPLRPNIVVIVAPLFNPGAPGSLGRSAKRSPAFDALVGRGVLFERARTASSQAVLSQLALVTGRSPGARGVLTARERLGAGVPTLATWLRAEGYLTGAVVRAGHAPQSAGFATGFHEYREYVTPPQDEPSRRRTVPSEAARPLLAEAVRWVRRTAPAEPFLLYVHLGTSWFRGYELRRVRAADRRRYLARFHERRMRSLDLELGEFLDAIDRLGVEPIILLTSDDGHTAFARFVGRPDAEGRGPVPLVVAGPGIPPGVRSAARVSSADVVPLLLDVAGIDPPPYLSPPPALPTPR